MLIVPSAADGSSVAALVSLSTTNSLSNAAPVSLTLLTALQLLHWVILGGTIHASYALLRFVLIQMHHGVLCTLFGLLLPQNQTFLPKPVDHDVQHFV